MIPSFVEVSDAPEGLKEFKVKNSKGARIGFFQVNVGALDDELVAAIRHWQARHSNDRPVLRIIRPADSVG